MVLDWISRLDPAVMLLFLLLAIALFVLFWPRPPCFAPKPLLTKNELEFYARLKRALPDLAIFPQVAMRALVRPGSPSGTRRYWRESGMLGAKHCDFLICDPSTLAIVVIIELDDRTHDAEKDAARDAMTAAAGYPTLRWHSRHKPNVEEIRTAVERFTSSR